MTFFSELTEVVFPAIGSFFSILADFATMPFYNFVELFTGLDSVSRSVTNFMTGEVFTYSLSPIGLLINSLAEQAGAFGWLLEVLFVPIRLTETLIGWLFSGLTLIIPSIGNGSTWVVLLGFIAVVSIPLVIFKRVRELFW